MGAFTSASTMIATTRCRCALPRAVWRQEASNDAAFALLDFCGNAAAGASRVLQQQARKESCEANAFPAMARVFTCAARPPCRAGAGYGFISSGRAGPRNFLLAARA